MLAFSVGAPAVAQTEADVDEARRRRDEVRTEAADVAANVDALTSEAAELVRELDLLGVRIAAIDSRLTAAAEAVRSTEHDLALAQHAVDVLESERSRLESALVASLVEHYIDGHQVERGSVLTADDPTGWALRQGLVTLFAADITTVQDQLRTVEADLAAARDQTAALAASAAAERERAEMLASEAAAAHASQSALLDEVSQRLDRRLAEAEALAELDAELSEEIRRGEEEIARRLAVARARQRQSDGTDDGGAGPNPADLIARPDEIVNVRGIEIHVSVADQLLGLINAAEAAGIILGGGGWRSTEYQIELRMKNCGTSDYLIFEAPSEECWPPTARPASSNHEAGLAVDFTANGQAITDRNSAAFIWLSQNAPSYGFYNLWSEPWHWSVDGR